MNKGARDLAAKVMDVLASEPERSFNLTELSEALDLSRKDRGKLKAVLGGLTDQGKVVRERSRGYRIGEGSHVALRAKGVCQGVFHQNPAGYGFVDLKDGSPSVFIPPGCGGGALDQDLVEVESWPSSAGIDGTVVRVVQRTRTVLTGTARRIGGVWQLEPDDSRLGLTADLEPPGPDCDGRSVLAEIVEFPVRPGDCFLTRVKEVLGKPGEVETEIRKILALGGIEQEFSDEALRQAEQVARAVTEKERHSREDLTHLPLVTIDPEDARDFDDAVCAEPMDEGPEQEVRLWVAIADVAHFVKPSTPLDQEARRRGFSVYLPHRAVPMLPKQLSSDVCSLREGKERLAMVVRMDLDRKGNVRKVWTGEAVIRPRARLDYETVARFLSGQSPAACGMNETVADQVFRLDRVSRTLREKRANEGMIELEVAEPKIVFGENGRDVVDVKRVKPDPAVARAYSLVEQCMLLANETVGRMMSRFRVAVPYRVHPEPSVEGLVRLVETATALGVGKEAARILKDPGSKTMARLAARFAEHRAAPVLQLALLRALSQASYSAHNIGHYAIASEAYLHFTSPIRRYPDLVVHRALKELIRRKKEKKAQKGLSFEEVEEICVATSAAEQRISDVERQAVDLFRAVLMTRHLGDTFDGIVSSVAPFGLFVQIEAPFVEGLVRTESLGRERFSMDDSGVYLTGRRSGRRFGPGDRMRVRILDVSILRRQIEMEPAVKPDPDHPRRFEPRGRGRRGRKRRRGRR